MFKTSMITRRSQFGFTRNGVWPAIVGLMVACMIGSVATSSVFSQAVKRKIEPNSAAVGNQEKSNSSLPGNPPGTANEANEASEQDAAQLVLTMLMALEPYQSQQPLSGKLAVFGTPTMGSLAHRWAGGLKRFHPQADIEISEMKTAETLKRLVESPQGVAMLSRPLSEKELEELTRAGLKRPIQIEVGQQGLGVFVHATNPINGIDQQQFFQIFACDEGGELTSAGEPSTVPILTWGQLGVGGEWASKPVHVIHRDSGSGTFSFLKNQLLTQRKLRPAKETLDSSKEVLETIARDPQAIGISNLRSSMADVKTLNLLHGAGEICCSDASILSGTYPLVRRITLVVDADSANGRALANEFVKFAMGQEGQRETILAGFFPLDAPLLRGQKALLEPESVPGGKPGDTKTPQ